MTDTNGLPVAGGRASAERRDFLRHHGHQRPLPAEPAAYGTIHVTPSAPGMMFVPSSRTYVNVTGTVSNENYLAVSTIAPALSIRSRPTALS